MVLIEAEPLTGIPLAVVSGPDPFFGEQLHDSSLLSVESDRIARVNGADS